jgi:hypothetical protein
MVNGKYHIQNNLCGYVRGFIAAILKVLFFSFVAVLMTTCTAFAVYILATDAVVNTESGIHIVAMTFGIVGIGIVIAFLVCMFLSVFIDSPAHIKLQTWWDSRPRVERSEDSFLRVIKQWMSAVHDKICPTIKFDDGKVRVTCENCKGDGVHDFGAEVGVSTCPICNGFGWKRVQR